MDTENVEKSIQHIVSAEEAQSKLNQFLKSWN
jgi:hypothetical protein